MCANTEDIDEMCKDCNEPDCLVSLDDTCAKSRKLNKYSEDEMCRFGVDLDLYSKRGRSE